MRRGRRRRCPSFPSPADWIGCQWRHSGATGARIFRTGHFRPGTGRGWPDPRIARMEDAIGSQHRIRFPCAPRRPRRDLRPWPRHRATSPTAPPRPDRPGWQRRRRRRRQPQRRRRRLAAHLQPRRRGWRRHLRPAWPGRHLRRQRRRQADLDLWRTGRDQPRPRGLDAGRRRRLPPWATPTRRHCASSAEATSRRRRVGPGHAGRRVDRGVPARRSVRLDMSRTRCHRPGTAEAVSRTAHQWTGHGMARRGTHRVPRPGKTVCGSRRQVFAPPPPATRSTPGAASRRSAAPGPGSASRVAAIAPADPPAGLAHDRCSAPAWASTSPQTMPGVQSRSPSTRQRHCASGRATCPGSR